MANDINDMDFQGEKIYLDKERNLRLTIPGTRYLAKKFGSVEKAFKMFLPDTKNIKKMEITEEFIDVMIDFLYSCLIHEDKNIEIDTIVNNLDFGKIPSLFSSIQKTIQGSMPDGNKDETKTEGE